MIRGLLVSEDATVDARAALPWFLPGPGESRPAVS
jgi:hypothetical protein